MSASHPPEPSPTRAVLEVWADPTSGLATGPLPGFSWVNGVAVGLMLTVDVLFVLAMVGGDGWRTLGLPLGLYAAGLTVGVAVIRPSRDHARRFWFILSPIVLQLLVYVAFWGHRVGRVYGGGSALLGGWDTVYVAAALCFAFGGILAIPLPFTRRCLPLLLVESAPLALWAVGALLS